MNRDQNGLKAWDRVYAANGVFFEQLHEDLPALAELLKKRNAHTVLDLGCGTGRHIVYLAEQGFTLAGVDASATGIATTRQQLDAAGLSADLQQLDIFEPLPFTDGSFDAVVSTQVIHHALLARIEALIDEIHRVLTDSGLLFVTVPRLKNQGSRFEEVEPNTLIPLDGIEAGLPHHYFKPEELESVLSAFQITDIHLDAVEHYCVTAIAS